MGLLPTAPSSAQSAANAILNNNQAILDAMVQKHLDSFNIFWYTPNTTPQQIADCFGTSAAALFNGANVNIANVATAANAAGVPVPALPSLPDGCAVTPNEDGTVTITTPSPWPPVTAQSGGE